MEPISGMTSGGVYLPAAAGAQEPPKAQQPEAARVRPLRPAVDEYAPEEKREPSGRYWLGKDGAGRPIIYFDDAERAADAPERPGEASGARKPEEDARGAQRAGHDKGAKGPKQGDKQEKLCTGSTDKVDREIEKLKKKRQELEQRLNAETDEAKIKDLKKKLTQVERELRQKDNDAYRRQHTTFS